jgi:hypothetical protein
MNDTAKILFSSLKGSVKWESGPRPKESRFVFIRSRGSAGFSLDNTSHFVNKLVFGNDYEWSEINN